MPASGNAPSIPVPSQTNTLSVLTAIRNWIIAITNTDGSRANLQGTTQAPLGQPTAPANFVVTKQVFVNYSFPISGGAGGTVTIPILINLTMTNPVTGEVWSYQAPGAATAGGTRLS